MTSTSVLLCIRYCALPVEWEWWLPNETPMPSMPKHQSPDMEISPESRIPLHSAEGNTKPQ